MLGFQGQGIGRESVLLHRVNIRGRPLGDGENQLPRKIAVEATPDNINTMRMNDKALLERQTKERAEAVRIMNEMKEVTLTLRVKGGGAGRLFGSVTTQEISEALKEQMNIDVDKRKIVLDEAIKNVGTYTVKCKLGYEVVGNLKVKVEEL